MNEQFLVKKVVPAVIKKYAPESEEIVPAIVKAIETVGCRKQLAATNIVATAVPVVPNCMDILFSKLNEALSIAAKCETENYDLIVETILDDNLATLEQKVEHVIRLENNRTNNYIKRTATTGAAITTAIAAAGIGIVKIIEAARKNYFIHTIFTGLKRK